MYLKNRTLIVLRYLWENTDESHTASLEQIKDHIEELGFSRPDSRSIKGNIEQLIYLGVDIVKNRGVQNQYFIGTRHFDTAEIKLLIDAVQSSRFITHKKSQALIEKLSAFVDPCQKQILERQLYIAHRAKTGNEAILILVDHIHTAISNERKVCFRYFDYTPQKAKIHRHEGYVYTVSPYAMLWNSDQYYVVGYSDRHEKISTYRLDRMVDLEISDSPMVSRPEDFRVSDYLGRTFSMFSGEECQVELLCANELMGSMIDRFGEQVCTSIVDEDHFKAAVTVAISDNFYGWVFASGGKMKILSPIYVVEGFNHILNCFR